MIDTIVNSFKLYGFHFRPAARLQTRGDYSNSISGFIPTEIGDPHTKQADFNQLTGIINKIREKRSSSKGTHQRRQVEEAEQQMTLFGIRVESAGSDWGDDGVVKLLSHSTVRIRLFGQNLSSRTVLAFTSTKDPGDGTCEFPASEVFLV